MTDIITNQIIFIYITRTYATISCKYEIVYYPSCRHDFEFRNSQWFSLFLCLFLYLFSIPSFLSSFLFLRNSVYPYIIFSLSACLSNCPSLSISLSLSLYPSLFLFLFLSLHLSPCLFYSLSFAFSFYLSLYLFFTFHLANSSSSPIVTHLHVILQFPW